MRLRFGITISIILGSLFILGFGIKNGKGGSSILVVDLSEVAQYPESFRGREVRIRGFVQAGSILRHPSDQADFVMEQEGKQLHVFYLGKTQLPDTFSDGAPIRVDGRLNIENTFVAKRIEAKCASKYDVPFDTSAPYNAVVPFDTSTPYDTATPYNAAEK